MLGVNTSELKINIFHFIVNPRQKMARSLNPFAVVADAFYLQPH